MFQVVIRISQHTKNKYIKRPASFPHTIVNHDQIVWFNDDHDDDDDDDDEIPKLDSRGLIILNKTRFIGITMSLSDCCLKRSSIVVPNMEILPSTVYFPFGCRKWVPANLAEEPSSSSIRSSWLYFAKRSLRHGAPVLIYKDTNSWKNP